MVRTPVATLRVHQPILTRVLLWVEALRNSQHRKYYDAQGVRQKTGQIDRDYREQRSANNH